jgi:hypothetical protein
MAFTNLERLRLSLDDPNNGPEDPFFSDEQLDNLLAETQENDLNAAASQGWLMKAAAVSDWYQATSDGSSFSRQQVFEHCLRMANKYEEMSSATLVSVRMEIDQETGTEAPGEGDFA